MSLNLGLQVGLLVSAPALLGGCGQSGGSVDAEGSAEEGEEPGGKGSAGKGGKKKDAGKGDSSDSGGDKEGSSGGNQDSEKPEEEDEGESPDPEDDGDGGGKFDLGSFPEREKKPEDKGGSNDCDEVEHKPCDHLSDDLLHAFGMNCPGAEPQVSAKFNGHKDSRGVIRTLGKTGAFSPREGKKYLVLGTGPVKEVNRQIPSENETTTRITYCNKDLNGINVPERPLPPPIKVNDVGRKNCKEDPSLVGKGDCSNTIQRQWEMAKKKLKGFKGARDYTELRVKAKVPSWANSFSYRFAFLTIEYPVFYKSGFNDFFVAWLESKSWTGNISFDESANPISLNAGFLDFKDATKGCARDPDCPVPDGCDAPELHGTCFQSHAGTKWLKTKVGVTPGEEIELVFAIFDLGDAKLDSYVLLDGFQWHCEEQEKPETDNPPQ